VVEPLGLTVADGPVGKERSIAAAAGIKEVVFPDMFRYDSSWPAKLASGKSSAVALERTATRRSSIPDLSESSW
jgi:hypothetical protein